MTGPIRNPHMDKNKQELKRLGATLKKRTISLATTQRQLQKSIARRKLAETKLRTSSEQYARLLKESLLLQKGLRTLTHQVLRVQEDDRKQLSHKLQDEIAQALLGINVRLLSLKTETKGNTKGLKQGITNTQQLVAKSARSVRRVARKFGSL
jgi:signal transduction histidine kinase